MRHVEPVGGRPDQHVARPRHDAALERGPQRAVGARRVVEHQVVQEQQAPRAGAGDGLEDGVDVLELVVGDLDQAQPAVGELGRAGTHRGRLAGARAAVQQRVVGRLAAGERRQVGEQVGPQLLASDQVGEADRIGVHDAVQPGLVDAQHAVDGQRSDAFALVERRQVGGVPSPAGLGCQPAGESGRDRRRRPRAAAARAPRRRAARARPRRSASRASSASPARAARAKGPAEPITRRATAPARPPGSAKIARSAACASPASAARTSGSPCRSA